MPKRIYKTKEQADAARIASVSKSVKEHYTAFTIRFNKETEKDAIDTLASVENKTGYIRDLILADAIREGKANALLEAVSRLTSEQRQALLNFIQSMQK